VEGCAGKSVLITGGSSGIGLAIAEALNGTARNLILVSKSGERLGLARAALSAQAKGSNIYIWDCDIGHPAAVRRMAADVLETAGCPDILINNAGFAHYKTFDQMSEDEVEETADVNFIGFLRVTRAFIAPMKKRQGATIVNVASVAGAFPITPNAVYSGAKAGMMAFSELLEIELRPFGIAVVTVCPGRVATGFFDHPTYNARRVGRETKLVTPMADVVRAVLKGIALRRKLVFVPSFWRIFAWALNADRIVLRPLYRSFLSRRVARSRGPEA
jgi:short-subunit dehydrogenase